MWFYVMIVSLIVVLVWLTRVRGSFVDAEAQAPPDPRRLFAMARELLNRYENSDIMDHAVSVHNKDPGELARMALGIKNA